MDTPPSRFLPAPTGRGTGLNPPNRFERLHVEADPEAAGDADLSSDPALHPQVRTEYFFDSSESILTRNDSPDVPFTFGLNPYRGCEHGCIYCFARPYHDYLGFSSGLDFETKILVKLRAPELLRRTLGAPRWRAECITMSGATDCYQPAERQFRLTRGCLEVCAEFRQPVAVVTKSPLVTRDCDVLGKLARHRCAAVYVTLTSLDSELAGALEPRAARPARRLAVVRELSAAGVPVGVMVAPVIPGLTEPEIPAILAAAAEAGALTAGYTLLRLPYAVRDLFLDWLDRHVPSKKARIVARVQQVRGGRFNAGNWSRRMHGEGVFAEQIARLFEVAARRAGLNRERIELSTASFRRPGEQLSLW